MERNTATIIQSFTKKSIATKRAEYTFHVPSYSTEGKLSLYEALFKKVGHQKKIHFHKKLTEVFTVLEGEFIFYIKDNEHILKKEGTIIIPPLVVHGFRAMIPNSRLQILFCDNFDRDDFFVGLAKIVNGKKVLNEIELEAFYNKYDQFSVHSEF